LSLELSRVAAQVGDMVAGLKDSSRDRQERLSNALAALRRIADDIVPLQDKIARSRTSWLVAGLTGRLDGHFPPPSAPPDYQVLATDGSQIPADRHHWPHCYLLNTGFVSLRYGDSPAASLTSYPQLYFNDEDMVIASPRDGREFVLDDGLLGIKRGLEEWRGLVGMAAELPAELPGLALVDGTLVLWSLEKYPDFVTEALLVNGYLKCLDDLQAGNHSRLALASYISMPRATEVVRALQVAVCPWDKPDCDRYCLAVSDRKCNHVAGLIDGEIFYDLLAEGERSGLFYSQSRVVRDYYDRHRIYFFYVRVGGEIGRVEIPAWVAEDESLLGLTHALVLDQCRRGQGYPVALSEAHEQAVVTGADRENFWRLVDTVLADRKIAGRSSEKSRSKRMRWI
jgi:GNAT superfamily N-acetyltransferase